MRFGRMVRTVTDIGLGFRRLRASSGFAVLATGTLAVGIGVTSAGYSVSHALLLRSMAFEPAGLALVSHRSLTSQEAVARLTWMEVEALRTQQTSFLSLAIWTEVAGVRLETDETSILSVLEAVSGGYFQTLRVEPALGRLIQPADDSREAPPVIVLSDPAWRARFGADPQVVGRTVRLAARSFVVIGVAPPGFRGLTTSFTGTNAGWVNLSSLPSLGSRFASAFYSDRSAPRRAPFMVAGRLRPGVEVVGAAAEFETISRRLGLTAPEGESDGSAAAGAKMRLRGHWSAMPARKAVDSLAGTQPARAFVAVLGVVLLVACTNLTSLALFRGTSRRRELAVRQALGASRLRVARQELSETALIVAVAAPLGLVVSHVGLSALAGMAEEPARMLFPGLFLGWRLEPVAVLWAGGAGSVALLVGGLWPAVQMAQRLPAQDLRADDVGSRPRGRVRAVLIGGQAAASVSFLVLAGVLARVAASPPTNAGLAVAPATVEGLVVATIPFSLQAYDETQARLMLERIVVSIRGLGVDTVALASGLPVDHVILSGAGLSGQAARLGVPVPDARDSTTIQVVVCSPDLFKALRLRSEGRVFDERDTSSSDPVVVLDSQMARNQFGSASAVGRQIAIRISGVGSSAPTRLLEARVVGVVPTFGTDEPQLRRGVVYLPLSQHFAPMITIVARPRGSGATNLASSIVQAVRRADPALAVIWTGRAEMIAAGPLVLLSVLASAARALGAFALALAVAGLYGVLSQVVASRMKEMGVRKALGASPRRLMVLVFRRAFYPVCGGLAISALLAFAVSFLFDDPVRAEVSPLASTTFLFAAVPLVVAACAACYLPARRAARVDVSVSLRES